MELIGEPKLKHLVCLFDPDRIIEYQIESRDPEAIEVPPSKDIYKFKIWDVWEVDATHDGQVLKWTSSWFNEAVYFVGTEVMTIDDFVATMLPPTSPNREQYLSLKAHGYTQMINTLDGYWEEVDPDAQITLRPAKKK